MTESTSGVPPIRDFRPFVICTPENYETSKAFYRDLGFETLWDDGESACEIATGFGQQRFLLTLHHGLPPTTNAMLHFWVESAQHWYDYMMGLGLDERYPDVKITPPVEVPWGWLITYVMDPSGVKLHFAEPNTEANREFFNAAPWLRS